MFFLLLALLAGCRKQPGAGTAATRVIARAGDAELTLDEARRHIDTTRADGDGQIQNYVSYWVNSELIYQEAKRTGIDRTEEFTRQLSEVGRQLAGQILLDRKLNADTGNVSEDSLQAYYQAHQTEFFIHDDMVKLNLAAFNSRERASAFAAQVSQGTSWNAAVSALLKDTAVSSALLSSTAGEYFTAKTLFPPELWKVAQALDANEVSFPIKALAGYIIVQSLRGLKQGAPAPFELARDEVRQRFLQGRRRQHYDELLGTLRKQYAVQLLLDSHKGSDSLRAHE